MQKMTNHLFLNEIKRLCPILFTYLCRLIYKQGSRKQRLEWNHNIHYDDI